MDRREALKKLAIGGALAAGGSIVLSSNAVAYAQSGVGPSLSDFVVTSTATGQGGAGILELTGPPPPSVGTTTYQWEILGCDVPTGRTLVVINSATGQIIARGLNGGCGPFPVPSAQLSNAQSVLVRTVSGGSATPKELEPGDSVSLKLTLRWNGNETAYNVGGVYPDGIEATQA